VKRFIIKAFVNILNVLPKRIKESFFDSICDDFED
jgi:hypothetical protein